jgi:ABC-2 type transport system ATP-binding protein
LEAEAQAARPAQRASRDDARRGGPPAIEATNLAKRYGKVTALADLSLTVARGSVLGFLGPNGAGKTTAVKLLLGLTRPSAGSGSVLGAPLGDRATRKRIGYLPELFRYQDWLSAREVLQLHCDLAEVPKARHREEIEGALDVVGLVTRADHRVGTFSKGMQQRLGLGVALLGEPDLVFLDEPTSALDPIGRHDVREVIRSLQHRGTTVFLNSHLLSEVEQVCDSVAVVDRGRVLANGPLDEILGAANTVRVRAAELTSLSEATLRQQFGEVAFEEDWYTFRNIAAEQVPDLVAEVVRLGGRVSAVESHAGTLEERFLQLLRDEGTGA